jgi:two-component system response regulator FixJ
MAEQRIELSGREETMIMRRAYIVDDDPALRRTIARMLAEQRIDAEEFGSAEAFLTDYSSRPIGCVLLDVRLPGMDGLQLLERMADLHPANPVIILSGHGDIPSAVRAVKVGAFEFLQKPFRKEHLLDIVTKVFEKIEKNASKTALFEGLTPREREVLAAFSDGAPNKVVAGSLGLSPRTVEMHRARIFKKLSVTNLSQALRYAREAGLLTEESLQRRAP